MAQHVAAGWRVEMMGRQSATLVSGQPCNHLLHLILTLVTCGFWAIAWVLFAVSGTEKRITLWEGQ